jgi:hypothetical protein
VLRQAQARAADRNESKRKDERTCASLAHARRQAIEPPRLSVQSIIGAMQNLRSKSFILLIFFVLTRAGTAPQFGVRHSSHAYISSTIIRAQLGRRSPALISCARRTHTARRACRSNFTPFVEGSSLSRESNGIQGRAPHGGLRHHMQIVCISMTPQAARDNGNERRSRYIDVHSRHRYRSRRGGA